MWCNNLFLCPTLWGPFICSSCHLLHQSMHLAPSAFLTCEKSVNPLQEITTFGLQGEKQLSVSLPKSELYSRLVRYGNIALNGASQATESKPCICGQPQIERVLKIIHSNSSYATPTGHIMETNQKTPRRVPQLKKIGEIMALPTFCHCNGKGRSG